MSDNKVFDDFIWWTGVVESRADPLFMNRVKVRCFGWHTEDTSKLPTADLPWAHVVLPTTASGNSGIGETVHGLVEGSWVFGFFKDGKAAQDPVVLGAIVGVNQGEADITKGFYDPTGTYPRSGTDGVGDDYTQETDVNKLARGTGNTIVAAREAIRRALFTDIASGSEYAATFDEPENTSNPVYPLNKVKETESGHLFETDDTPGAERIVTYHKAGTYDEVQASGTKVVRVVGNSYQLTAGSNYIYVKGDVNMQVDGNMSQSIGKNYNLEVGGNWNIKVGGNEVETVEGNIFSSAGDSISSTATTGSYNLTSAKDTVVTAGGNLTGGSAGDVSFLAGRFANYGGVIGTVFRTPGHMKIDVGAYQDIKVGGVVTETIGASFTQSVAGFAQHSAGASYSITSSVGSWTGGGVLRLSAGIIRLN